MTLNLRLAENDPFSKKQPIRTRKKRLQESSRLGQKNFHPELEALPLLKGKATPSIDAKRLFGFRHAGRSARRALSCEIKTMLRAVRFLRLYQ